MWLVGVFGALLIAISLEVSVSVLKYTLDNSNVCQLKSVVTKWLGDDDSVIINAKSTVDRDGLFKECVIKFGPSSESTRKTVRLKIESFYINSCGVYLAVQQSPAVFFNEHVSTMLNFSCDTRPASERVYHADANNNIKIFLLKKDRHLLDYNFILNITLVDHEEMTPGISSTIVIGICVVVGIAIIGAMCIVYRYLKIKKFSKQQFENGGAFQQHSLSHQIQESPLGSARYSNLPLGEIASSGNVHSQTCIVGSLGTDGLCTVCHRHHDDFAHVVDIGPNGEVLETTHDSHPHPHHQTSHIRSSERDNSGLRHDSRTSTPRSRHTHAHNVQISAHRHSQPLIDSASRLVPRSSQQIVPSGLSSSGELMVDDDDIDIDVSGNDLIPPSYDLSPPSYDEAVNMPKPDEELEVLTAASQHPDVSETDPLYQNIETFPRGIR